MLLAVCFSRQCKTSRPSLDVSGPACTKERKDERNQGKKVLRQKRRVRLRKDESKRRSRQSYQAKAPGPERAHIREELVRYQDGRAGLSSGRSVDCHRGDGSQTRGPMTVWRVTWGKHGVLTTRRTVPVCAEVLSSGRLCMLRGDMKCCGSCGDAASVGTERMRHQSESTTAVDLRSHWEVHSHPVNSRRV